MLPTTSTALVALGFLSAVLPTTQAFSTKFYRSQQCTGIAVSAPSTKDTISEGCHSDGLNSISTILNGWSSEDDNGLLLVTYKDDKCCHSQIVETISWADSCTKIQEAKSWRIVDAEKMDSGKEGESYDC